MTTTELSLDDSALPADLTGKVAIVTGGSSGIGYATSKLLVAKGATVHNVDVKRPGPEHDDDEWGDWANYHIHIADVTEWAQLRAAFDAAGVPDFVFANAGGPVGAEDETFFDDYLDDQGRLMEPQYDNMAVNTRGTVATVKLAWSSMRKAKKEGSIVITGVSLGYFPEQGLPIWSSAQSFLLGLVRALRNNVKRDKITINAVAPGAVITGMLPWGYAVPLLKAGINVCTADDVARALVFSATAREPRRVEVYGKEEPSELLEPGRWNGRVILQLGEKFVEVEERICDMRDSGAWIGPEYLGIIKQSQAVTDWRED